MSKQSAIGKQTSRDRAPGYPAELRANIERDAAVRYARWQDHGRAPVWFRLKSRLRRVAVRALAWTRR